MFNEPGPLTTFPGIPMQRHYSPLDHNACERQLQKRIDELEEELRKERAGRAKMQAAHENASTHAVCVGWEVGLISCKNNWAGKHREYWGGSLSICKTACSRCIARLAIGTRVRGEVGKVVLRNS